MCRLQILSLISLLCLSAVAGESSHSSQCGGFCFSIVEPLLPYVASVQEKESRFSALTAKIQQLEATIESLESQLELSKSHQRHCLTKGELLASNQDLVNKLQEAMRGQIVNCKADQLGSELKNQSSEILRLKSEARAVPEKRLSAKDAEAESEVAFPSSCIGKEDGIYELKVSDSNPFEVPCDSSLVDSGWTVIQRRLDGSVDFKRNMQDYRSGFGQLEGEFFIGLDKLHQLTSSQPHELYVYMKDVKNKILYGRYANFSIAGKEDNFRLNSLGSYEGNVNDGMSHHLHWEFSTFDHDHDLFPNYNCALLAQCGWWFSSCFDSLNAKYDTARGGIQWRNSNYPLKFVQMMIRPKE